MKKTFFKSILFAGMFLGTMASCSDVEDLYNPELVREKAKKALGLDIAADQDWNMTSVVTANFTLTEDALSDYSFRIYSANPISDANAVVLADKPVKTDAQGKASASFKFEMPSYLKYVYVARVDNHGRRMIGISRIENGVINDVFGKSNSVSTKAVTDYELPTIDAPYTESEVNTLLADAYDITEGLNNGFNQMYNQTGKRVGKIENTTYTKNIGLDVYYYNSENAAPEIGTYKFIIGNGATWEFPEEQRVSGVDIIVAKGGTIKFSKKLTLATGSRLIVLEGGIIDNSTNPSDVNIVADHNTCLIYNEGTITANYIEARNGTPIYNTATGFLNTNTIKFSGGNNIEKFINLGKVETDELISNGNQGEIYNGCLIRADICTFQKMSIGKNSAIESTTITCNEFYLRENSIVRANKIKTNWSDFIVDYVGKNGQNALLSASIYDFSQDYNNTRVHRDVFIELENIYRNGVANDNDFIKGFITKVGKIYKIGEAPLIISAEESDDILKAECVGDGNTPQDKVIEELLSSTFTYAFEDLNKEVGDYDMNDVVLKCTGPKDGKITVRLVAAGATKNLYVYFYNAQTNVRTALFEGKEVHQAFGVEEGTIVNTGISSSATIVEETISVNDGFLFTTHGDIYIMDEEGRESHIPNFDTTFKPGDAPYGICVPCNWRYPKEYANVITAYPEFANWAGDVTVQDWYTTDKADTNSIY